VAPSLAAHSRTGEVGYRVSARSERSDCLKRFRPGYFVARCVAVTDPASWGLLLRVPFAQRSMETCVPGAHLDTASAVAELSALRERLTFELRSLDVVAACAGTHPLGSPEEAKVSGAERHRLLAETLRFLARKGADNGAGTCTSAFRAQKARRGCSNRLRENVPVLLALSANSPFSRGRDSGFPRRER
jgi:Glutamate-cysteine ligase family 2(GCS2)